MESLINGGSPIIITYYSQAKQKDGKTVWSDYNNGIAEREHKVSQIEIYVPENPADPTTKYIKRIFNRYEINEILKEIERIESLPVLERRGRTTGMPHSCQARRMCFRLSELSRSPALSIVTLMITSPREVEAGSVVLVYPSR